MMTGDRDILDVSAPASKNAGTDTADTPVENQPVTADRPIVDPDAYDQTRDSYFLNRFMEKKTEEQAQDEGANDGATPSVVEGPIPETPEEAHRLIVDALREVYDPEIPVNIYEMGLIYEVNVAADYSVDVMMTLTTPNCPVAETMPGEVEMKVKSVPGVKDCLVQLVWEPAWDMSLMSDEARLELGLL